MLGIIKKKRLGFLISAPDSSNYDSNRENGSSKKYTCDSVNAAITC